MPQYFFSSYFLICYFFFFILFESSFSGLALALSASHQRNKSTNLNSSHQQHHHQHHHHHHRHHSKHQDDNIYTNIALGNCIQNLMGSKCESVGLMEQKEFGIPIPKNRNYDSNSSQQSSPGSGFFCGSPNSPSQYYSAGNVTPSGQLGVFSSRISRAASPQRPTIICPDQQRLGKSFLWIFFFCFKKKTFITLTFFFCYLHFWF